MKRLYLILFFVQFGFSQDDLEVASSDSIEVPTANSDTLAQAIPNDLPSMLDPSIPLTIDAGYKGFLWGSDHTTSIITSFSAIVSRKNRDI